MKSRGRGVLDTPHARGYDDLVRLIVIGTALNSM
jgi:hypothetical protein